MAFKLVEIFTELTVRDRAFKESLKQIRTQAEQVELRLREIAVVARRVFAVSAAALTGSAIAFAGLDKSMARVRAITQSTTDTMAGLTETAKEMGRTTIFSAKEAGQAMAQLALQGFTTSEIYKTLPATLNVAAISMIDVATAAKLTAGVMRSAGKSAGDLENVIDILAAAATRSSTTVAEMAIAFRQVGPTATQAGVSVEELGGILQVMATRMIRGELAGTALRNLFTRMAAPPAEARRALQTLGITVADAEGNFRNIIDVLSEFIDKINQVGEVQKVALIRNVAGFRAIAPLSALVEAGSETLRRVVRAMQDVGGIAGQIAKNQLDNLQDRFTLLRQAINLVGVSIGEVLRPELEAFIAALRSVALGFDRLTEATKKLVANWAVWAAEISAVVIALPLLVAAFRALVTVVVVLGTVLVALVSGPLGIILVALGLLLPTLIKLVGGTDDLTDAVTNLGKAFSSTGEVARRNEGILASFFDKNNRRAFLPPFLRGFGSTSIAGESVRRDDAAANALARRLATEGTFDPSLTPAGQDVARNLMTGITPRQVLFGQEKQRRQLDNLATALNNLLDSAIAGINRIRRRVMAHEEQATEAMGTALVVMARGASAALEMSPLVRRAREIREDVLGRIQRSLLVGQMRRGEEGPRGPTLGALKESENAALAFLRRVTGEPEPSLSDTEKLERSLLIMQQQRLTLGGAIRQEIEKRAAATFKTTGLADLARAIQESIAGPTPTQQRADILKAAQRQVSLAEERNVLIQELVTEGIGLGVQ